MRISTTLIFSLAICFQLAFAQTARLRRADDYYNLLSYASASEQYELLLGSKVDSPEMKSKLANAYYQIGKTKDAQRVYQLYLTESSASAEDVYRYAQTLKENGNYPESDRWMQRFVQLSPADQRAKDYLAAQNYLQQIAGAGAHFTIDSLRINSSESDFGGYLSPDGKDLFFVSARRNPAFFRRIWQGNNRPYLDIYEAELPLAHNDIDRFSEANTVYHEGPLCFGPDGKTVYFTRNNVAKGKKKDAKGIQQLKIYVADVDADGNWKNVREFPYNSVNYSAGHPAVSADGTRLYFASTMPGTLGGADIFYCTIGADGTFGKPVNLGNQINTEGQEMFPWIGPENELFYASDGLAGLGGLDVFVAQPDGDGLYSRPQNAGKPLNSEKDDFALAFSNDRKTGWFSSNRDGGKGSDDIYSFTLVKPFKIQLIVKGTATDKAGSPLAGTTVHLMDNDGKQVTATTGSDGAYRFDLDPEKTYQLKGTKADYFDGITKFSTVNLPATTEELTENLQLEKDPGLALRATIFDAATKQPLSGVIIHITDKKLNTPFAEATTGESGQFMEGLPDKKIGDEVIYVLNLQKEGYLSKTVEFKTTLLQAGIVDVTGDLSLSKLEVGGDLAKLIDIRPIYFDYGKYFIRPDAAKELDKIVKIMNEYPTMEIELGSHTDCRGSVASNEKLSDNRAKASAAYVKSRISNPERIYGKGYGESKLKNGCACEGTVKSTCSEAEHQENRRTEFIIMKM